MYILKKYEKKYEYIICKRKVKITYYFLSSYSYFYKASYKNDGEITLFLLLLLTVDLLFTDQMKQSLNR